MRSLPTVEPAPPPITIVDPNAPPGHQEILGSDGGWRPSPYQKLVTVLTALIVALLVSGVQRVRHVHHERSLDTAALNDVSLSVGPTDEYFFGSDAPEVVVTNGGRLPLSITGLQLTGDGHRERRLTQRLGPGESGTLQLSSAKNCRPEIYNQDASGIRITARTSRGDDVVRTLQLPAELAQQIGFFERFQCGFFRPAEAFSNDVVGVTRRGRDVVVKLHVWNQGVIPITLTDLGTYRSITVTSPDLPLTLERRAFWTGRSPEKTLTVTLRVTDCAAFAADNEQQGDEYDGAYPGSLRTTVSNEYREDHTFLGLVTWDDENDLPDPQAAMLLRATCPSSFFPRD